MPERIVIAKMLFLMGLTVSGYKVGDGAYYHRVDLRAICEHRVEQGWNPGLNCAADCLAAWGLYEPEMLGQTVAAYLPGAGFRA